MSTAAAAAADTARALYERHASHVYSLCLRRLGSREEAEDAAQTVFLNAFGALRRGTRPRFESAWLRRIAENVCHDRRSRIRVTRDLHALEDVLASPEREPGALAAIEQALSALPETQRRAIVLREWHGLSYREIAAELGLSEGACEALAFRARRTLADRLRGSRESLSLLGWLKPALGGSAAATKVAAVVGAVAVGAGFVPADEGPSRSSSSSPAPPPRVETSLQARPPAGDLRLRSTPTVPERARPTASPPDVHAAVPPAPRATAPAMPPTTSSPSPDRAKPPAARPPAGGNQGPQPPAGAPAPTELPAPPPPVELPVDISNLPVEVPALPVEVPELPVDVPELPVQVPPLPLDPPALPTLEVPEVPPVEPPNLPPLPPLL